MHWTPRFWLSRRLIPREDRGPLRAMFVATCLEIGGAETLLAQLLRRLDREEIVPELCCLKYLGPLGEELAREVPAYAGLLAHKYDLRVLWRLARLMRRRRIDAVVTVGTGGDRMFWGRLAAWLADVPVICSALHSTGVPDYVELPNRLLAPLTDAFIAVAVSHGRYLAQHEGCPAKKVRVIPNGVDTRRFAPQEPDPSLRAQLGLPAGAPVVSIVAALRPEKNHELFLHSAALIRRELPEARFLVVGDGPRRPLLQKLAYELSLDNAVHFLGVRQDIPAILALTDVFLLASNMEANPVSILEAMACAKPVVATRVGSIPEAVIDGQTGYLVPPGDARQIADRCLQLLQDPELCRAMGCAGRKQVANGWSVERMVRGYEDLLLELYQRKAKGVWNGRPDVQSGHEHHLSGC